MNTHDKNNLDFLLNIDHETLAVWFSSVPEDDISYALELLRAAIIENAFELNTDVEDFTEAKEALSHYTLKGKI